LAAQRIKTTSANGSPPHFATSSDPPLVGDPQPASVAASRSGDHWAFSAARAAQEKIVSDNVRLATFNVGVSRQSRIKTEKITVHQTIKCLDRCDPYHRGASRSCRRLAALLFDLF
jgi:hypothetical protein